MTGIDGKNEDRDYSYNGNIYFLQVGEDGPIKIGYTSSPIKYRIRALQMSSPHILRWIGFFVGTREDEKRAHRLLASSSLRGEWFHPTIEVKAFVQQMSPNFEPITSDNPLFHPHRVKGKRSWAWPPNGGAQ